MVNLNEEFGTGGSKPFSWQGKSVGAEAAGKLVRSRTQQSRKFLGPGKPPGDLEFWNNDPSQPKMQLVLTILTTERDPMDPQDKGERDLFLPGWGDTLRRVRKAMAPHGGTFEDGADVSVKWIAGAGVSGDGRQFDLVRYVAPTHGTSLNELPEPAPAAPVGPVTTPAPVAPTAAASTGKPQITQAQADAFSAMGLNTDQFDIVG